MAAFIYGILLGRIHAFVHDDYYSVVEPYLSDLSRVIVPDFESQQCYAALTENYERRMLMS